MSMVINSNIMSLTARRSLTSSQNEQNQALERLSSGLRINSAADDAAGLSISSRMTSQVKGLNQAVRNANDGISLIQTAEGALAESTRILQRMRELSLQSANDTYDAGNRHTLNAEVTQMKAELNRIAETTRFNGLSLLDGSLRDMPLQLGADTDQSVSFSIGALDADSLGVTDAYGLGAVGHFIAGAGGSGTVVNALAATLPSLGAGDLIINGVAIDAADASSDHASAVGKSSGAIATAAAINKQSEQTGVTAVVGETVLRGNAQTAVSAMNGSITLNGVEISLQTTDDASSSRASVVAAINAESSRTGVTAINTGSDTEGVALVAPDGRNISLGMHGVLARATGLGVSVNYSGIATGTLTLISSDDRGIEITSSATGQASDAGFQEGIYSGTVAQVSSSLGTNVTAMSAGDVVINGIPVGASIADFDTASSTGKDYSAISKAAAINAVSEQTGVNAVVNDNIVSNSATQTAAGGAVSGTINGVAIQTFTSTSDTSTNRQTFVNAVNAISDQTGVRAIDTGEDGTASGGGVQLVAEDGRNIELAITGNADVGVAANGSYVGDYTLKSDREIRVSKGIGTIENSGLPMGNYGAGEKGTSIANIDISTISGAQAAIDAIDNAVETINGTRGDLGAMNNRLDFTINNLSNISENVSSARSQIEDADYAQETANLSRTQILQQASTAMLAQANASALQVMTLLQR